MLNGQYCRTMSTKVDQRIGTLMGSRSMDEFVAHMVMDACTPEHLDGLAFQLLCCGRACKTRGLPDFAREWKQHSKHVARLADEARTRLAAKPNQQTHPGFFNKRSVGRPGCLDSDLHLPYVLKFDLDRPTMYNASYEPDLLDGATYRVHGSRDGKTWIEPVDGGRAFPVANHILRGLLTMGRIEALPLSAAPVARAA